MSQIWERYPDDRRVVTEARRVRGPRAGLIWELTLECGHSTNRQERVGVGPPSRVRCDTCRAQRLGWLRNPARQPLGPAMLSLPTKLELLEARITQLENLCRMMNRELADLGVHPSQRAPEFDEPPKPKGP